MPPSTSIAVRHPYPTMIQVASGATVTAPMLSPRDTPRHREAPVPREPVCGGGDERRIRAARSSADEGAEQRLELSKLYRSAHSPKAEAKQHGADQYDKFARVLRLETTTNDVSFFEHHRKVEHQDGHSTRELAPLKKTIYSLVDLREILAGCNRRYLEFLSAWTMPPVASAI